MVHVPSSDPLACSSALIVEGCLGSSGDTSLELPVKHYTSILLCNLPLLFAYWETFHVFLSVFFFKNQLFSEKFFQGFHQCKQFPGSKSGPMFCRTNVGMLLNILEVFAQLLNGKGARGPYIATYEA